MCPFELFVSTQEFHKTPANGFSRHWESKQNFYLRLPRKAIDHKGIVLSYVSGQHLTQRVPAQ